MLIYFILFAVIWLMSDDLKKLYLYAIHFMAPHSMTATNEVICSYFQQIEFVRKQ
ncbi:hypothetical protein XBKB1_2280004 [Xenorhabdus bovienii str. kraussei Becker Underwood]|uniref:Uncharacterized protein n=1 Tax=Xenorhabdus bovienii str. kraussei Becker Underwood TaxID=1398204 RepID=A0A077PVT5_XENBV|nr:hypothetical protein XBKB1_2280004 [Xenorhabdus bovienii str. kraussei Becker Underwood]